MTGGGVAGGDVRVVSIAEAVLDEQYADGLFRHEVEMRLGFKSLQVPTPCPIVASCFFELL